MTLIGFQTMNGTQFVNPEQVTRVADAGGRVAIHLTDGGHVIVDTPDLAVTDIARILSNPDDDPEQWS